MNDPSLTATNWKQNTSKLFQKTKQLQFGSKMPPNLLQNKCSGYDCNLRSQLAENDLKMAFEQDTVQTTSVWYEIGTYTLKVMPKPCASASEQIWNRSFKWGTKYWFLSRGQSMSLKKISADQLGSNPCAGAGWFGRIFFQTPTLKYNIFAAPWSKLMFNPSFKRSISYLFGDQRPILLNDF